MGTNVFVLALIIFRSMRAEWAAWEESAAEYAEQGYKPHRCFHGTNLWTDYDNICQGCEDYGFYFHNKTYAELALDEAKAAFDEVSERTSMVVALHTKGAPIDISAMGDWIIQPLTSRGWVPEHKR